ncbi:sensor histidine kinase [Lysobacter claricitrinus]|uniref:sensor histidine kinase n=1 Tax=Lysobacter claricitrinus TaxID=3367728 RepID=UPI0037DBBEFA
MSSTRKLATPATLTLLWQPETLIRITLVGEALAAVLALAWSGGTPRWTAFAIASLATQWVLLLSLGGVYLLRSALSGRSHREIAWALLALIVANSLVVLLLARATLGEGWLGSGMTWSSLAIRVTLIVSIVGLLGLSVYDAHWKARLAAVRAQEAELESLKARVHPHFLFNTLNTAIALVHEHPDQAESVLLGLAELVRMALAKPQVVELRDEIEVTRAYLDIESLRFGDRLRVQWTLPPDLPRVKVPALSLQPLVENAIHHSIERVERGGTVDIALESDPDWIVIRVRSPLVLGKERAAPGHGVGMRAAQARVEALTNGTGRIETQTVGEHYVATVRLPRPRPASAR